MAGGRGTRLYPLTQDQPKPMTPLVGRPILDHQMELLRTRGCDEVIITTGHHCNGLFAHLDRSNYGDLRVFCAIEEQALGTAGGVRNAAERLDDTFFVLSGDAVTDVDISGAVALHRQENAMVTIIVKRVADVRRFGMVIADKVGRVTDFEEKPLYARYVANALANTGMYILEPEVLNLIPPNAFFDFARDLFPLMLRKGMLVLSYETSDYWCDVGTLEDYHVAHRDVMHGLVALPGVVAWSAEANALVPNAHIHPSAHIRGPVFIGPGAIVHEGCFVGPFTTLASDVQVGPGSQIMDSVINSHVSVGSDSRIRRSIIGNHTALPSGSRVTGAAVKGYVTVGIRTSATDPLPPSLAGRQHARMAYGTA